MCVSLLEVADLFYQQAVMEGVIGVAETEVSFVHVLMAEVTELTLEQVVMEVAIGDRKYAYDELARYALSLHGKFRATFTFSSIARSSPCPFILLA